MEEAAEAEAAAAASDGEQEVIGPEELMASGGDEDEYLPVVRKLRKRTEDKGR